MCVNNLPRVVDLLPGRVVEPVTLQSLVQHVSCKQQQLQNLTSETLQR